MQEKSYRFKSTVYLNSRTLYIFHRTKRHKGPRVSDSNETDDPMHAAARDIYASLIALDALLQAAQANPIPACHVRQLLQPALKTLDRTTS